MNQRRPVAIALSALLVMGCSRGEPPVVRAANLAIYDAYAPAQPLVDVAAAYFVVVNNGEEPDTLVAIASPMADRAQLHRLEARDGRMQMTRVDSLPIPARGRVRLAPGGFHVMLHALQDRLEEGDTLELIATFSRAGAVRIPITVLTYSEVVERTRQPR